MNPQLDPKRNWNSRPLNLKLKTSLSQRSLKILTPSTPTTPTLSEVNSDICRPFLLHTAPKSAFLEPRRHPDHERGYHLHPLRVQKHPQRFEHHYRAQHSASHSGNDRERTVSVLRNSFKNSVSQVDYLIPHQSRPLEVRVANQSLYVDPKHLYDVSPQISSFLTREFGHYGKSSVEPNVEDLNFDELLEAVKVLCPTDLGIFPASVTARSFASLARLSRQFEVIKLKKACELFVARLPLLYQEITALQLAEMLDVSCRYGLNLQSKLRLLQGCLVILSAEEKDSAHFPTFYPSAVDSIIAQLIKEALLRFKQKALGHDEMLNEARLKIPCRLCRVEENPNMDNDGLALKVCKRCRQTICFRCQSSPCSVLLARFWESFGQELKFEPKIQ